MNVFIVNSSLQQTKNRRGQHGGDKRKRCIFIYSIISPDIIIQSIFWAAANTAKDN